MKPYLIPAASVSFTEEIKKSRFITLLEHTSGVDEAKLFIQSIKEHYPDARHHCWAFVAGAPDDSQQLGFSDDGEPTGTAGKPMIAQLIGSGVGEITAVSVRYFGGIKLGTGGLVKAYGNGVQQALKLLGTEYKVPQKLYQLRCEYSHISMVEQLLQQFSGQVIASDYAENVTLQISLPATLVGEIGDKLRDLSRGVLSLTPKS
ncbi:IMPACT family protein [Xenorhabdus nematophila]|uniref:IMPACT family protein n=1 Tax=Xenorhabdus nematophila TaxID=628 RepID=UPI0003275532|nr:IMPACT family protein [Xenorhabdus nematophila]CEE90635.1 putative elongation factor, with GTP-binding EF-G domain [Xenorhabdus nematophila str. Anatoliense]CEF28853.1 putative elongation factor, with GTP-binding EF-G domain [Xenorhabdus nematophila str. Websteri]AYA42263.1 IMPACT family protein [Xenorhabdus nematophila]MBA0020989.1 IMPACT family protein [Xenorhabdus nematophila]MCB4425802.1 IMPACT family protein [Xenorhabdus nematophila]